MGKSNTHNMGGNGKLYYYICHFNTKKKKHSSNPSPDTLNKKKFSKNISFFVVDFDIRTITRV